VTTNNVVGLEMVLMTGEVIRLGGKRQGHQVWCQSQ
jgi:FAD/FMN-containing dehydrogenase